MWRIFQDWGRVWEVFIPNKRDKGGNRFGFVRFSDVTEPSLLARKLDKVFIGNMKLFVNIPKFSKPHRDRSIHNGPRKIPFHGTESRVPVPGEYKQALLSGLEPQMKVKEGGYVTKQNKEKAPLENRKALKAPLETNSMQWQISGFNLDGNIQSWLAKSWVGKLRKLSDINTLQQNFILQGFRTLKVRYLGDFIVLLSGEGEEDLSNTFHDMDNWLSSTFEELNPWKPIPFSDHRVTWLRCFGIPLHLWNHICFSTLIASFGSLVALDDATLSFDRVEFARLRIRTKNL
ncbi:uncharacterized protein LOC130712860 [Lotus japonicus]|uniref:uncharacterized protein LOC130712860 n=1 Tax=Lotus japonicus TaxID=34305 RepID=UPI0025898BD7|nr:uncharacterized protein LOC130712860 [Lotus japonicus]